MNIENIHPFMNAWKCPFFSKKKISKKDIFSVIFETNKNCQCPLMFSTGKNSVPNYNFTQKNTHAYNKSM